MRKLCYIGGGSTLLLLTLLCGAFFASPLIASAHGTSTPTQKQAQQKAVTNVPLREFTKNYKDKIVDQIAPQLHLSSAQLIQKLQNGERIVKIAKEQGVSASSLKTIIINSFDNVILQALVAKKIDQQRVSLLKNNVHSHPFVVTRVLYQQYYKK